MLESLRQEVLEANLDLVRSGLIVDTFGNASGIAREEGLIVIKPSGVAYGKLRPQDLVVTALDGRIVEGDLRPSSDLATHLVLYLAFPSIGGVVHTHSHFATVWAQSRRAIPCFGTTHADYFHGPIPVTDSMTPAEIAGGYEANTGEVIARAFAATDPMEIPAVVVCNHGPFAWGATPAKAVHNAFLLEEVARMAFLTVTLNPNAAEISRELLDQHYYRKHGARATYGQQS